MSPSYAITRNVLGFGSIVEIDAKQFEELRNAREATFTALFIEEKFNDIVEAFKELELDMLRINVDGMLSTLFTWERSIDALHSLNRKLLALMSQCQAYLDQVPHKLNQAYGKNSPEATAFKLATNEEYNRQFAHRFMETLRNYGQHNDMPLHGLSAPGRWVDRPDGKSLRQYTIDPTISVEEMLRRKDKLTPRGCVKELEDSAQKSLPLKRLLLEYLDGLGRIHKRLREMRDPQIAHQENLLIGAIRSLNEKGEKQAADYIHVNRYEGVGPPYVETFLIFEDAVKRRRMLARKNGLLALFSTQFVSGEHAVA